MGNPGNDESGGKLARRVTVVMVMVPIVAPGLEIVAPCLERFEETTR